jgi:hypothetical protein
MSRGKGQAQNQAVDRLVRDMAELRGERDALLHVNAKLQAAGDAVCNRIRALDVWLSAIADDELRRRVAHWWTMRQIDPRTLPRCIPDVGKEGGA